jgi:hypothetical protein
MEPLHFASLCSPLQGPRFGRREGRAEDDFLLGLSRNSERRARIHGVLSFLCEKNSIYVGNPRR